MPAVGQKRGRGRPKGSRSASKVVKNSAPPRRSTRGTTAPRTQEDGELQADEHETDKYEYNHNPPCPGSPMSDASPTWEVERQKMQAELQKLKKKCSNLKESLTQSKDESAERARVVDASQDQIEELQMGKCALLRRAIKAEDRATRLAERVDILECGQPGPFASASASRTYPPPSFSRPYTSEPFIDLSASAEDGAASPRRSQQASGGPGTSSQQQTRTAWDDKDADLLVKLIGKNGPHYSKLEKIWKDHFPNRHPRDQRQMKDKARNLKISMLKNNLPLLPRFDDVCIDAKGIAQIKAAGYSPYRMEDDNENQRLIDMYLDNEQE